MTSDHGESLGEEGRWFHGRTLSPELLDVPLIVVGEGVVPGRTPSAVGHDAIRTTLLAAAGATTGDAADLRRGTGLGVVEGGLPPYLAYRISGRFEVIVDRRTGAHQLFQLDDRRRAHDLASVHPELATVLAQGLMPGGAPDGPPPELRERLRAIGYVD